MGFAQGEEKMVTMDEVMNVWESKHISLQSKQSGKGMFIPFFKDRKDISNTHYEIKIKKNYFTIGFHIKSLKLPNSSSGDKDKLCKFLERKIEIFKFDKADKIKKILLEPVRNESHSVFFDIQFKTDETTEVICDYMEQFIALTYKGIAKYIGKNEKTITLNFGYPP